MSTFDLDALIWWVGAVVLGSVGFLGAAAIVGSACALAVAFTIHHADRLWHVSRNLADMRAWRQYGKPRWRQMPQPDGRFVFEMVPSSGPFRDDTGTVHEPEQTDEETDVDETRSPR